MEEKPGFCPKRKPGQAGICVLACLADNDCSGAEKCCHTGCGYACMKPLGMSINMVSPYLGILRLLQVYAILLSAYSRQLFGPRRNLRSAYKSVHFAPITDSFVVSFSRLIKFWSWMQTFTANINQLYGPEKLPGLLRNRPQHRISPQL